MKIGKYYIFIKKDMKKIKYHSIEFQPNLISKCAYELLELLNDGYEINDKYNLEGGVIFELVKF